MYSEMLSLAVKNQGFNSDQGVGMSDMMRYALSAGKIPTRSKASSASRVDERPQPRLQRSPDIKGVHSHASQSSRGHLPPRRLGAGQYAPNEFLDTVREMAIEDLTL